ncbi:hypothetical protein EDB82DRAFT_474390 [Fusarium venenatum]|uniref:uncharacterized protein n=1 Tax=Fusarium venenatum TaxID=56646 RepID=UPI001D345AF9|nr:hypothetical protein EDB82DRAFT_474390 [Fusarium venenatum]
MPRKRGYKAWSRLFPSRFHAEYPSNSEQIMSVQNQAGALPGVFFAGGGGRGGGGGNRGGGCCRLLCHYCGRYGHAKADCQKWQRLEALQASVEELLLHYNTLAASVGQPGFGPPAA